MSIRSFLAAGLLASSVLASPPGYGKTVTVTETKEIIKKTKTVTDTVYKTKTKTITDSTTVTKSAATVTDYSTVTASAATTTAYTTITSAASCPTVSSPTSASSSATSKPTSSGSTASTTTTISSAGTTTTTSSSSINTNPTTTILATATASGTGLNKAAKATGKLWLGTAADYPGTGEATDPYYLAELNNTLDFGEVTPANIMKFVFTEPEQNVFNYTGAEEFLALTEANGQLVRCHNLIWYNQLPTWVTAPAVNWTNATLTAALKNHVTNLVTHFGDRCYSWDVVNEAFSDSPAGSYQSNIWYDTIGPAYVVEAFQAATDAVKANNLNVKLYYNDYNIEYAGNKSLAAQNLVKDLKNRGIQIDGVGLESHFIVGETPSQASQQSNMEAFTALGVNVAVTELDVRLTLPATAATETQQVVDYYNTVAACVAVEGCIGVTVWDFDDTYSWIPSTFKGQGYGDLFLQPGGPDTPLVKKAAYDGVLEALTGQPEAL